MMSSGIYDIRIVITCVDDNTTILNTQFVIEGATTAQILAQLEVQLVLILAEVIALEDICSSYKLELSTLGGNISYPEYATSLLVLISLTYVQFALELL